MADLQGVVVGKNGVAVGLSVGRLGGADGSAGTGDVLNDEHLTQLFLEIGGQNSGVEVGVTAVVERNDNGDRLFGPGDVFCRRLFGSGLFRHGGFGRVDSGGFGGGGSFGLRAAGGERQNQNQREKDGYKLLHDVALLLLFFVFYAHTAMP